MTCHECLMLGAATQAPTALCRFCFVALCKEHLVESLRDAPSFPQYTCRHTPAIPPAEKDGRRAANPPLVQLRPAFSLGG